MAAAFGMVLARDALAAMQRFPVVPAPEVFGAGQMLILAPHVGTESPGCGGLIAAAAEAGRRPFVMILTDGAAAHPGEAPARDRRARQAASRAAMAELGVTPDRLGFLGLPGGESPLAGPAFDAAVTAVASLALRLDARLILASWAYDAHPDHESAHLIAAAAALETVVPHVAYPVWGLGLPADTELPGPMATGRRIDVTPWLPQKRRAIQAHGLQQDTLFEGPFEILLDAN